MIKENEYELPDGLLFYHGTFTEAADALQENKDLSLVMKLRDVPVERPTHVTASALLPRKNPAYFLLNKLPSKNLSLLGSTQKLYYNKEEIKPFIQDINPKLICEKVEIRELATAQLAIHTGNNWSSEVLVRLNPEEFVPRTSEGIFVILCHSENVKLRKKVGQYHDDDCFDCSNIERQIQQEIKKFPSFDLVACYVYKDDRANYHGTISLLHEQKIKYITLSQSTTYGFVEAIFAKF